MQGNKLYVSLDSLLDIRLGVLNTINPDYALSITGEESYYLRNEDVFTSKLGGTLKKENYDLILKDLQSDVIENSFRTKMYVFINHLRTTIAKASIQSSVSSLDEVDVNIFPYIIEEEAVTIIIDGISKALGGLLKVNLINASPQQLKLSEARKTYSCMIMYEYADWLNEYTDDIKKKPLRETNIYVPRLFFSIVNRDKLNEELAKGQDPFEATQRLLSPIINIEYIPVAFYCADVPMNKDEYLFE